MDKASRPVRNRRHSRRAWPPGEPHHPSHRLQKRLFTPEIKRMLKDWLVRRRENPYPSRDEKKSLAINTGLTYIQICNWFANWRRKLKNAGREPMRKTWGHLIKTYNVSANGNVEQFSICSEDSIWGDDERPDEPIMDQTTGGFDGHHQPYLLEYYDRLNNEVGHSSGTNYQPGNAFGSYFATNVFVNETGECPNRSAAGGTYVMAPGTQEQCFQISSTTQTHSSHSARSSGGSSNSPESESSHTPLPSTHYPSPPAKPSNTKYKNNIMEKYLRDLEPVHPPPAATSPEPNIVHECNSTPPPKLENGAIEQPVSGMELSKWLESAANFTPKKNNYIEWETRNKVNQDKHICPTTPSGSQYLLNHEREDLEAAEVLTSLAGNYRNRMFGFPPKACVASQP